MRLIAIIPLAVLLLVCCRVVRATEELGRGQAQLAARMEGVERRLLELAGVTEDSEQAEKLRRALQFARRKFLVSEMEQAASLLEKGRFQEASAREREVLAELRVLADMMAEGRGRQDLSRLRQAAEMAGELLRRQSEAAELSRRLAQSGTPPDFQPAVERQSDIAESAEELLQDVQDLPGGGALRAALKRMRTAEAALSAQRAEAALNAQMQSLESLEKLKEALQRAAEQAEAEREARARAALRKELERLLRQQQGVRTATEELAALARGGASLPRALRLKLRSLSARQRELAGEAEEPSELVGELGETAAWPEALRRLRGDLQESARLLEESRPAAAVRVQRRVERLLGALIEALEAARRDLQEQLQITPEEGRKPGRAGRAARMKEELTVVRALQTAINRRSAALTEEAGVAEELAQQQEELRRTLRSIGKRGGGTLP